MDKYIIKRKPAVDLDNNVDPSSKRSHIEVNLNELPADPRLRIKISDYSPNIRDEVRRTYLLKGPCQPRNHDFPYTIFGNKPRRFNPAWFFMGAGGQMNVLKPEKDICKHVPVSKPPFGIADLKKAIPPHCFKRSLVRSFGSFFRDLLIIYSFFYLASTCIPLLPPSFSYVAWPLYWFAQGSILMGFWILGHECGHHAFSEYRWVDDAVGFFIHSFCLTPYFSFKYSHRSHHAHTNSIEYDEVYIPKRKPDKFYSEFLNNGPGNVVTLLLRTTLGLPLYLIFNTYGRDYKGFANHFLPQSAIFKDSERGQIVLSDAGIAAVLYVLYRLVVLQGLKMTIFLQGMPLFVMGGFFIILTYLNHSHPAIAHYDSTEWDWIRGALSTIDRDLGFMNRVFHNAPPTHGVHHLFPTIPHYHAIESREAIKPILGDYYMFDDTPMMKAMWRDTKECIYVEPDQEMKGVYWYNK